MTAPVRDDLGGPPQAHPAPAEVLTGTGAALDEDRLLSYKAQNPIDNGCVAA